MRELTKDLENIKGDLALNYKTIPVVYGVKASKVMLTIIVVLTLIPTFYLTNYFPIGKMVYFFYLSIILLVVFILLLWRSSSKPQFLLLHNILKLIILAGVFCIPLIDVDLLLNRII